MRPKERTMNSILELTGVQTESVRSARCWSRKCMIYGLSLRSSSFKTTWTVLKTWKEIKTFIKYLNRRLNKYQVDTLQKLSENQKGPLPNCIVRLLPFPFSPKPASSEQVSETIKYILDMLPISDKIVREFLDIDFPHRYAYTEDLEILRTIPIPYLTSKDRGGASALHYAAAQGSIHSCSYLLEQGMSPLDVDSCQYNCIDIANYFNREHVLELFQTHKHIPLEKSNVFPLLQYQSRIFERTILLVYNPVSGQGYAKKVCLEMALPLLTMAGAAVDVMPSQYAKHASKIAEEVVQHGKYDCVFIVGGDGSVFEFINGLTSIGEEGIRFPIGQIPSGSGNAIAACMGWDSTFNACRKIVEGTFMSIDVFKLQQPFNDKISVRYGLVVVGWGLISAIDFDSEHLRFMGESRFSVYALYKILSGHQFPCSIEYHELRDSDSGPIGKPDVTKNGIESTDLVGWKTIDNSINFLVITNGSQLSGSNIFAKDATLNDGKLWMVVARNQNPIRMLSLMVALETGEHEGGKGVDVVPVDEFIIRPMLDDILLDVDGERFPAVPAHVKLLPHIGRFAC